MPTVRIICRIREVDEHRDNALEAVVLVVMNIAHMISPIMGPCSGYHERILLRVWRDASQGRNSMLNA